MVYVALLRGINVGGKTAVSMARLKECFEGLGFQNVKTYINSGNVVFTEPKADPRKLETDIERMLEKSFSFNIKVVVRNLEEMDRLMANLPKSWQNPGKLKCNIIFLRHEIDNPNITDGLEPKPDIEEIHYQPGVLFWSAATSNLTKSNMIKLSSNPIYQNMTVRGLNTTRKILALMHEIKS